ncbi:pre-toxin TG domain-containing protein [Paenibacillus turicensis]|uniref:pre-toxin TG domain-containing protein n=1 Tax=Paenibacillus turicensis TaxID=160487 RepID=UPI003D2D743A
MQIEVRASDLEELGSKLRRSGSEMGDIRAELQRAMRSLTLRSQGRTEVDASYQSIERMLQQLEQDLDRFSRGLNQKGKGFDEADGKAPPFEWGKVWQVFKVVTSMVLDFVPIVGNIKGLYEALTGRDLITGAELSWYERALALAGPLGKGLKGGAKLLKASNEVVKGINKIVKATDTVISVVDNGKSIVEAITGVDMLTGENLKPWQRLMGLGGTAASAGMSKVKNKKDKLFQAADEVTEGIPKFKKADAPLEGMREASIHQEKGKHPEVSAENRTGDGGHGLEATAAGTTVAAASAMRNPKDKGSVPDSSPKQDKGNHRNETETPSQQREKNPNEQHIERANKEAEIKKQEDTPRECKGADPIHIGTGQQFIIHTALMLYGAATWDFTMYYNSGLLQKSGLGLAWTHNYDMRLELGERNEASTELDTNTNTGAESITVFWSAGRRNQFTRHEDGIYRSNDTDVLLDTLCQHSEGYELRVGKSRERYYFNENGVLLRHVNAVGMVLHATHNEQGQLMRLEDGLSGRAFHFSYNKELLTKLTDGVRTITFDYDQAGWMSQYIDAVGMSTTITCDDSGRILTMSTDGKLDLKNEYDEYYRIVKQYDAKGSVTTLSYDADSRPGYFLTTITNRAGEVEHHVYNNRFEILEIRGEEGIIASYTYNERGQRLTESHALGEVSRRTYDEKGLLRSICDALGNETTYDYNESGVLIAQKDALGGITHYSYDDQERLIGVTRPDGSSCRWNYNEVGQLLAYHDYNGETKRYIYNECGDVAEAIDEEGRQTTVLLDDVGRIKGLQQGQGEATIRTYDENDKLIQVKDELGRTWQQSYDLHGRITETTDPTGAKTTYTYTPTGNVAMVQDALGAVQRYEYDGEDRLIQHEDARGGITKLTYDQRGRLSSVIDPLKRSIYYHYDAVGRLEVVKDATGNPAQSLTYDQNGQPIAITNALGHTTRRRFNALYQPVEQIEADGVKTEYHYDELSRLHEVIQDSETWRARYTQTYDAEHRKTMYQDANGNETKLIYNRSGQLTEEINATGHGFSYHYDEQGRLSRSVNGRGKLSSYGYDAAGQLLTLKDEVGQVTWTYDEAGRWIEGKEIHAQVDEPWKRPTHERRAKQGQTDEQQGEQHAQVANNEQENEANENVQSLSRKYDALGRLIEQRDVWGNVIGYRYDEAHNLTHLTYPDGKVVEYRYNLANELVEVKDWAGRLTRYRYDENGHVIETHRPNGTRERRSYDALGQLLRQQDVTKQGMMLQDLKYEYNEVGQIIREQNKQFTYDQLRRLVSGANQGQITYYRYDLGGNLTEQRENDPVDQSIGNTMSALSYSTDNRLHRIGKYPTELDADGNLLYFTDGEKMGAYEYDARNRLIQSGRMKYRYNWKNERIETIWRGKVTRYVVDDSSRLSRILMEQDREGNILTRYVYGLGLIGLEDARTGKYLSYHSDQRGSTTILTDEQGIVTDRYAYGIYGEVEHYQGSTHQPFQYNGRDGVMTDANGLYYMRARYYHPELKRFLNRDTVRGDITDGQTFNRYAYVNGDPVKYVDPLGLSKEIIPMGSTCPGSIDKGKFPSDPDELIPELPREIKGDKTYIYPNEDTRIRIEQHKLEPEEIYNARHHGLHYHIEIKTNSSKSWKWHNRKNLQEYIKPSGYTPNSGTGFIPGEYFPGWKK